MQTEASRGQALALMALRISLGLLLFWWGLAKIIKPGMGVKIQGKFYFDLFPSESLQFGFGFVEMIIGLLVMFGLFRKFAMPAQLAITGFSAMTIWSALLDPFGVWLPVAKVAGVQHLFYPTVIALCGAAVMLAFRHQDRLNLDTWRANRRSMPSVVPAE